MIVQVFVTRDSRYPQEHIKIKKACELRRQLRRRQLSWTSDDRKFYERLGEGIRARTLARRYEVI